MDLALDLTVTIATLTLVVLGLGIILGLMNIVNLSHTGLMAVGVYAVLALGRLGVNFWLATLGATIFTAAVGSLIEFVVIRRLYDRHIDDTIMATWGISLILVNSISWIFGREPKILRVPVPGGVMIGGIDYPAYRLVVVVFVALIVLALAAAMRLTRAGLTVRMVMTNSALASAVGINTLRVQHLTFITGAAFAGLAGALLGPTQGISPTYALGLLAPSFMAVLMSGKNLAGLIVACVVLGGTQTLITFYVNPVLASVMIIFAAVVVLRIRPEGFVWRRS